MATVRLIAFVDDGNARRVLLSVTMHAIIRCIETAVSKPLKVSFGEFALSNAREVLLVRQKLSGCLCPEEVDIAY